MQNKVSLFFLIFSWQLLLKVFFIFKLPNVGPRTSLRKYIGFHKADPQQEKVLLGKSFLHNFVGKGYSVHRFEIVFQFQPQNKNVSKNLDRH